MIMMPYGWTLDIAAALRSGRLLAPHRQIQVPPSLLRTTLAMIRLISECSVSRSAGDSSSSTLLSSAALHLLDQRIVFALGRGLDGELLRADALLAREAGHGLDRKRVV